LTAQGVARAFENKRLLPNIIDVSNNRLRKDGTIYLGKAL